MITTLEVANSVSEFLLKDQLKSNGYINQIADVRTGVLNGDKIYTSNAYDIQGAVKGTCNPTYTTPDLYGAKEYSGITPCAIARKWCAADIDVEMTRNQNALSLDENEAAIKTISDKLGKEYSNAVLSLFFLANPASSNAALNFGPLGVIPQAITAAGTAHTQSIGTGDTMVDVITSVVEQAEPELKEAEDAYILINQKAFEKLRKETLAYNWVLETSKDEQFNGWKVTSFLGYKVVVCSYLDRAMTLADNALYGEDYFVMFTTKSNIRLATSEDKLGDTVSVKLSTNEQDLNTYALVTWAQSTAIVDDGLVSIAY